MTLPNQQPIDMSDAPGIDATVTRIVDHIVDNWYYLHGKDPETFPHHCPTRGTLAAWVRLFLPTRGKPRLLAKPRMLKRDEEFYLYGVEDADRTKPYWGFDSLRVAVAWTGNLPYSTAAHGSLWPVMEAQTMVGRECHERHQTFAILFCIAIGRDTRRNATARWARALGL